MSLSIQIDFLATQTNAPEKSAGKQKSASVAWRFFGLTGTD